MKENIIKRFGLNPGDLVQEYKGYYLIFFPKYKFGNVLDLSGYRRGWVRAEEETEAFSRLKETVDHVDFRSDRIHQEVLPSGKLIWHGNPSGFRE